MKKNILVGAVALGLATAFVFPPDLFAVKSPEKKSSKAGFGISSSKLSEIAREVKDFSSSIKNDGEKNFVLGYADLRNGKYREAEAFFKQAGNMGLLKDYLLFFRAQAALNLKNFDKAEEFSNELLSNFPDSALLNEAAILRAEALIGLKRYDESVKILESKRAILSADMRRKADEDLALALAMSKDPSAVSFVNALALRSVCEDDIKNLEPVFSAVKNIFGVDVAKWLSETSQEMVLAQSFFDNSEFEDASKKFEKLLQGRSLSREQKIRAKWMLSRCYRSMHRYDESIALMNEIKNESPLPVSENTLLGALATVYSKKNDYDKAIEIRRTMLKRSRNAALSAEIASKIAFLYMDQGKYDEAIDEFEKTLKMRGGAKGAVQAKWNIAWCYYMAGKYNAALDQLSSLAATKKTPISDRVLYWKARTLEKIGDEKGARNIFEELYSMKPAGYYGYLSKKRLSGNSENFSASPYKPSRKKVFKPDLSAKDLPLHLVKAKELDRLELNEEAGRELKNISSAEANKFSDEVMYLASKNFAHDVAFRYAYTLYGDELRDNPSELSSRDLFIWHQSYPEAWRPSVQYESVRRGVEPALVWSIMRSESNFRPKVVSPAGAVGLMQIMPFTAKRLMKIGKERGCLWDLYRPSFNIMLGVLYLKELSNMFDGNPAAIIASYNAGEEAAGRWLNNGRKIDIEEWIEEIPYAETNLYVKKVMAAYWTYKTIY